MYIAIQEAFRQLRRGRSRAAVIVAIMALGIGSCVTVFSMIAAVLLAEWPYANADRLAIVWHARTNAPGVVGMSASDVEMYRTSLTVVDGVATVTTRGYNAGGSNPFRVTCSRMSPAMLPLLGVPAQRGRWFTADEDARREAVVVVSERMWRTQLGSDPGYPGRDLVLDGTPHRVIGIMPVSFAFPPDGIQGLAPSECWVPASYTAAELAAPAFNFVLFARLKQRVTAEQATADANLVANRIWRSYPAALQSQIALEARVVPLIDQALGNSRRPLYVFGAAALLLLLIGCSNVTNLLLTSLDVRRRELAVRSSLGASRAVQIAQLLAESITLAIAGGLAGSAIASALIAAIVNVNAAAFPRLEGARVDTRILAVAILCSAAAGLLGGLSPAWHLRSSAPAGLVVERAASAGFARQWWRRSLIAFEIALAVLVLVLAGVAARTVLQLNAVAPGFTPRNMLVFSVAMPAVQYTSAAQTLSFAGEVVRLLSDTQGVAAAAAGTSLPVGPGPVAVLAPADAAAPKYQPATLNAVTSGYATAAGLAMIEGRFVQPFDGSSSFRVAVVNETLARAMWPSGGAIGRLVLKIGDPLPLTIVGVVADVRQAGPVRPAPPALYVPMTQAAEPAATLNFVVRSAIGSEGFASRMREIVTGLDKTLPAFALRTGDDLIAATVATHRFNLLVLGVFGAVAIALALAGVYGVLSHFVQQSRRSIGIRQALGATTGRIVGVVLGWAMTPVLAGIVAGSAAAYAAVATMASLLFNVSPHDPWTVVAVAVSVAIASTAAVLPTAVRASRDDIAALLRQE